MRTCLWHNFSWCDSSFSLFRFFAEKDVGDVRNWILIDFMRFYFGSGSSRTIQTYPEMFLFQYLFFSLLFHCRPVIMFGETKENTKKVPFMAQHVSYICEYSSFASNWYPLKWCFAVFKCSTWLCCCFFRSFIFLVLFNFEFNARWSNYECSFLNKSSFDHIENDEWHKSFDRYFSINSLRRNYYFVFMSLNTHFLNRISQIVNDLRSSES